MSTPKKSRVEGGDCLWCTEGNAYSECGDPDHYICDNPDCKRFPHHWFPSYTGGFVKALKEVFFGTLVISTEKDARS